MQNTDENHPRHRVEAAEDDRAMRTARREGDPGAERIGG